MFKPNSWTKTTAQRQRHPYIQTPKPHVIIGNRDSHTSKKIRLDDGQTESNEEELERLKQETDH